MPAKVIGRAPCDIPQRVYFVVANQSSTVERQGASALHLLCCTVYMDLRIWIVINMYISFRGMRRDRWKQALRLEANKLTCMPGMVRRNYR